ncbi:polysaccharide biosynthesis protein [Simiduia sp. 21SJ11W-1]|uniref:nucleoside-diphosphate sugar epimerase/dehydratase n=1 Tax=Simiduia sp. 21SJ11W-1 TaxID=2909669 RepID=UPI00209C82D5|nr:nucleoside-diphosphate sugar epimerase/dehydratase [Simiduia sp. 21SJ11W-1]UTA49550.1 polysaccharide biosynthesis protein [Simiduia sp. 21SJ11W-1]
MEYDYTRFDLIALTVSATASVFVFVRLGLYRAVLRYMTHQAYITIGLGVALSATVLAATSFMFAGMMPRSVPIIYASIAFITLGAPRIIFRSVIQWLNPGSKESVIIYGAGNTGGHLAAALQMGEEFNPIAFVDDDKAVQKTNIRGLQVHPPKDIPKLIERYQPTMVLLALGNPDKNRIATILKLLAPHNLRIATVPRIGEIIAGASAITELRDIKISDVLGRDPVDPIPGLLSRSVSGKVVMVTGAGGSIGSELSRQILALNPIRLVLFDNSEFNLYRLDSEIAKHPNYPKVEVVLGDIRNEKSIGDVIQRYQPDTLYHAAAYKHVPMVEGNVWEGIRNNAYGTLLTARAAMNNGVRNFVLISTDKAVRPTNVMGATKRFAELIIQDLQRSPKNKITIFSAVRFGNVLDSSGSVIPKFREQIANGGPVTITHPDITRYFMTQQEAAQLVIQAGAMAKGGEIFVLDMGEPVKIVDLAREMIALYGHRSTARLNTIEIKFTGLRPGEKLYEELLLNKQCSGTEHPRIWFDDSATSNAPENLAQQLEAAIKAKNIPKLEELILSDHTNYINPNVTRENQALHDRIAVAHSG